MVSDHKIRQELFHHLNPHPSDVNIDVPVKQMDDDQLAKHAIDYFSNATHEILYPAKSYSVAVIYSHLLELYFGVPFDTSIRDDNLLFGNDLHFKSYQLNPDVYDTIINTARLGTGLQYNLPQVKATTDYFLQEFFLNPNPYFTNANLHK